MTDETIFSDVQLKSLTSYMSVGRLCRGGLAQPSLVAREPPIHFVGG